MNRRWAIILLGSILGAAPVMAQEPDKKSDETPTAAESETVVDDVKEDEEELPEIDVWAEDAGSDDDVFIPSESISADSSIAFPADI